MNQNIKNKLPQDPNDIVKKNKGNKFLDLLKRNVLFLILISILIFGSLVSKTFLTINNLNNILINVSIIGILAIGQTFTMLTKQIDLSVGSLMAFSPIAAVGLTQIIMSRFGVQVIQGGNYLVSGMMVMIIFIILISSLIGWLNGIISVKAKVPPFIATLGMLYALRGIAYILSGGHPLYFTRLQGFKWLGTGKLLDMPVGFLFFLGIGILGILIVKFTKVGPRIYSTGGNEKAAIYSGINPNIWKIIAFTISGFCAGLAALIYCSRLESVEVTQATGYEFIAIAIVVIGGTTLEGGRGSVLGSILASIILGLVINIITLIGLVVWYQTIIIGIIIITAVFAYLKRIKISEPTT